MTAPSFRRHQDPKRPGDTGQTEDPLLDSPFSQAQIQQLLRAEFARAKRYGFPLAIVVIQVDRLLRLMDLHGTELRSVVRSGLARILRRRMRMSDQLGVLPEDRVLLVLPHTDLAGAEAVAGRLREEFARLEFEVGGTKLPLTLSLGVAADAATALFHDTLLTRAEAALQQAAAAGGDRVAVHRETPT